MRSSEPLPPTPSLPLLGTSWLTCPKNSLASAFMRAGRKLEQYAAAQPDQAWQHNGGLSSLLQAAKALPPREPWDVERVDPADATGLTKLLLEAKQRQAARHQGGE